MTMQKALLAAAMGWAVLTPAFAATTVIDFDNVADQYGLVEYTQGEYALALSHGDALATPQTYSSFRPPMSTGTLLSSANANDVSGFEITREAGQAFWLFSFEFGGTSSTVIDKLVVSGRRQSGETVEWTIEQPAQAKRMYRLDQADPRWTDLVSVDFAAYGAHNRAVFDSIVLMESAVPEPATLWSMLLGAAGLAWALKRHPRPQSRD